METTTAQLERTARRMVADLDPVEAVVLFGSRARGTAHADSDWDIAVLLDREPDPLIRAAVPVPDHVNVLYKYEKDLRERALYLGSLESAIVRDGKVLAGEWERPNQCGEAIVSNDLMSEHMITSADQWFDAVQYAGFFLGSRRISSMKAMSDSTQKAAEFVSKAAMVHLGINPKHVHDQARLADQVLRERPHDPRADGWAAIIRSMNGDSEYRNVALYNHMPIEFVERPFEILVTASIFHTTVMRDILDTRPEFASFTSEISNAVATRSQFVRSHAYWGKISQTMRDRVDTWVEEVQSIDRLAQSRTQQTAWGVGDPDESQGMSP